MATVTYRRNLIFQLKDDANNIISNHETKSAKNRMVVIANPAVFF